MTVFNAAIQLTATRRSSSPFAKMSNTAKVVTTSVPGVSATQTYIVSAATWSAMVEPGVPGKGGTIPAYPVLVTSTAFEYPDVVLGTMLRLLVAPPAEATPPWDVPLRVTLESFPSTAPVPGVPGPTPTDVRDFVPIVTTNTTPTTGSTTTNGPIKTSSSVGESYSPGLGTGAVAGVAIGCLLAGGLIFAVVFFWINRRRKNASSADGRPASTTIASDPKDDDAYLPRASSPAELHAPPTRAELPAQRPHAELPA